MKREQAKSKIKTKNTNSNTRSILCFYVDIKMLFFLFNALVRFRIS